MSNIEWTDVTWNPTSGCDKVSEGCRNCYAESMAHRFWGDRPFTDVRCHPERLSIPLRWKTPRRIFVNSMSDLFHEDVPLSDRKDGEPSEWPADLRVREWPRMEVKS